MGEHEQQIRIGMLGSNIYCLGFMPPVSSKDIKDLPREGLKHYYKQNDDGSTTVGYQRLQFGYSQTDRWDDFEKYAQQVVEHLGVYVMSAQSVHLDYEQRAVCSENTSLFADQTANHAFFT